MSRTSLVEGSVVSRSLGFGVPLALAMMGHGLFNLVDLVIVGRVTTGAVTAVTLGGIVITVAMLVFDGWGNGLAAQIARARGAGDEDFVRSAANESLRFSVLAGLVGGLAFAALSGPLVAGFGLDDESIVGSAIGYLEILAGTMVTMFLIIQVTGVLRGIGSGWLPLILLLVANVANIFLDLALVFGRWGFPKWGIVGAAVATALARMVAAGIGLLVLVRGYGGVRLRWPRTSLRSGLRRALAVAAEGWPTSVQLGVRVGGLLVLLLLARWVHPGVPTVFLDAIGVCVRIEMIAGFAALGFGAAATAFVGQNVGAGRLDRAVIGTLVLTLAALLTMIALGVAVWWHRLEILRSVVPEMPYEGIAAASGYLAITLPCQGFLGAAMVISRAVNGVGVTRRPLLVDVVLVGLILIPLAMLLSDRSFGIAERGVWFAAAISNTLAPLGHGILAWCVQSRARDLGGADTLPGRATSISR